MAVNGGIFGGFTGGLFNNNLQFNPGLTPGQVVPSNPAFNPTGILNAFFQPFPFAANSLMTSTQIALAGGGTPLIASFPQVSPFSNAFLNSFNPALSAGLGGIVPGAPQGQNLGANGAGAPGAGVTSIGANGAGGIGALAGLGGLGMLANMGNLGFLG
jgi:hypothetical protein